MSPYGRPQKGGCGRSGRPWVRKPGWLVVRDWGVGVMAITGRLAGRAGPIAGRHPRSHHGLGLALDAALAQSIARPARAERHPTSKTCPASHHLPFGHRLVNRRARITHRRTRARAARPACRLRTLQGAVPQQTTAST